MTRIVLNIEDDKLKTFMDFISTIEYVTLDTSIPEWQMEEVNKRLQMLNDGDMKVRSWVEAKDDIFK